MFQIGNLQSFSNWEFQLVSTFFRVRVSDFFKFGVSECSNLGGSEWFRLGVSDCFILGISGFFRVAISDCFRVRVSGCFELGVPDCFKQRRDRAHGEEARGSRRGVEDGRRAGTTADLQNQRPSEARSGGRWLGDLARECWDCEMATISNWRRSSAMDFMVGTWFVS